MSGDIFPPQYTRDEVMAALNKAAELVLEAANPSGTEYSESIRDNDLVNLVVNAAAFLLDFPAADLDDVILGSYDADLDPEITAGMSEDEVKALHLATVRSWIE